MVILTGTRLAMCSALIALVVPTLVVVLAGVDQVARVGDQGATSPVAGRMITAPVPGQECPSAAGRT